MASGSDSKLLMSGCVSPPRRLQEEDQQLRTSSLPAIPNPFPELCGPGSPPVLTRGSLPPSQAAAKQVSTRPWFKRQAAGLWGQDGRTGSFLWEEGRESGGSFLLLLSFNFMKLFDLLARIPFKSGMLSMCFRKRPIKMIKNNNLVLKDEC